MFTKILSLFTPAKKLFGAAFEPIANPFRISTIDHFLYYSGIEKWIFKSLIIPALGKIKGVSKIGIEKDTYDFVVFNYKNYKYYLGLSQFYNPRCDKWFYENLFIFYKPWIVGCNEAISEEEMREYTAKAILLWLRDVDEQLEI